MIDLSDASNSASRNDTTRTDLAVTVPSQTCEWILSSDRGLNSIRRKDRAHVHNARKLPVFEKKKSENEIRCLSGAFLVR